MTTFNVGGLRLPRPFRIRRIGHVGYHSPDVNATAHFLTRQIGLLQSDVDDFTSRVPGLAKEHATGYFLRCNSDHHAVVIGSQKLVDTREPNRRGALVGQVSWQVGSLREVVDGVRFLDERVQLRRIGRDAPGSNWHAYAYDPDGYIHEIFYGMEQVGWDGRSKPASMYDRAFHDLPELPQIPEYREVDLATAREGTLNGYRASQPGQPSFDVDGVLLPQPFKVTHLGHVGLFVQDLDASVRFYTEILGLTPTRYLEVHGHRCAFLRADTEHHTLALYPKALEEALGFGATYGLCLANYQQLRNARAHLERAGARLIEPPAELAPGIPFGFWVQGPDQVGIHLYYGMERVDLHGRAAHSPRLSPAHSQWPETIEHGASAWYDPPFMGPFA